MGTRNLVAVKLDGEYKVAQYGQWEGYPSGQGSTVLDFLEKWDRCLFEEKLREVSFLTDEEIEEINAAINAEGLQDRWQRRWPELSRDAGAEILGMIATSESGMKLRNSIEFAADSLFCEWAYVVDLDDNTLEVYRGFNHKELSQEDRFYGARCEDSKEQARREKDGYFPIRKVACYSLDALPSVEQLEVDCRSQEEKEEAEEDS